MLNFFRNKPSDALIFSLEKAGGGIHKRIDENRELLELLQVEAPQLLKECPWVIGWIQGNDEFFTSIAKAPELKGTNPRFRPLDGFPRDWPETNNKQNIHPSI